MISVYVKTSQKLIAEGILRIANKYDCEWSCNIDLNVGYLSIRISAEKNTSKKKLAIDMNLFEFEEKSAAMSEYIAGWFDFYFKKDNPYSKYNESEARQMDANLNNDVQL